MDHTKGIQLKPNAKIAPDNSANNANGMTELTCQHQKYVMFRYDCQLLDGPDSELLQSLLKLGFNPIKVYDKNLVHMNAMKSLQEHEECVALTIAIQS